MCIRHRGMSVQLRDQQGMNSKSEQAIPGGTLVTSVLEHLLEQHNNLAISPYMGIVAFMRLMPFTGCNGKISRALWLWDMIKMGAGPKDLKGGFLTTFYPQAIQYGLLDG